MTNLLAGRDRWVCGDTEAAIPFIEAALGHYKAGLFSGRPRIAELPGGERVAADADDMTMLASVYTFLGLSLAAEPTIKRADRAQYDFDFDRIKRESRIDPFGSYQHTTFVASRGVTFHRKATGDDQQDLAPGIAELQYARSLCPRVFGGACSLGSPYDHHGVSMVDSVYNFASQWVRMLQRLSFAKACYTLSAKWDAFDYDTVIRVVDWITLLQPPRQSGVTRKIRRRHRPQMLVKPNLDDQAIRRHILQTPLGGKLPAHDIAVPTDALAAALRLT